MPFSCRYPVNSAFGSTIHSFKQALISMLLTALWKVLIKELGFIQSWKPHVESYEMQSLSGWSHQTAKPDLIPPASMLACVLMGIRLATPRAIYSWFCPVQRAHAQDHSLNSIPTREHAHTDLQKHTSKHELSCRHACARIVKFNCKITTF